MEQILDEAFRNIKLRRPELNDVSLLRTRNLMNAAVRDSLVTGYEPLIDGLTLPDKDDHHVLAAAVKSSTKSSGDWASHRVHEAERAGAHADRYRRNQRHLARPVRFLGR